MAEFIVHGPFDVPYTKGPKGDRRITKQNGKDFWSQHTALENAVGCYVFCLGNKTLKPIYVGKTANALWQRVFNSDNLEKFTDSVMHLKGTPKLFLIVMKNTPGKINAKQIDEVETHLIQAGLAVNPEIANDKKTKVEQWRIQGVVRAKQGEATKASAKALRQTFKIKV
jgi:hypothetical protein